MKVIDYDSLPADPLEALRELSRLGVELEELRRRQVDAARQSGATWEQIGKSLGMSRQSAWEFYTRDVRELLDETAANAGLEEDDAIGIATDEVSRIRRRHRRTGS